MSSSRVAVGLALLAVLGAAWWFTHRADVPAAPSVAAPAKGGGELALAPEGTADNAAPAAAPSSRPPIIDKAERDKMRERIWAAFGQAPPAAVAPAKQRYVLPEHGDLWTGTEGFAGDAEVGIEPEYIQKSVRAQFFPVAQKCYGDALEKTPKLAGSIHLWFVIVGDAKIGGIVESVDVLNKSTLRDPDVIECLRESFLGVTFPPPKGGGAVTVEYPITFSPEDDDGGP